MSNGLGPIEQPERVTSPQSADFSADAAALRFLEQIGGEVGASELFSLLGNLGVFEQAVLPPEATIETAPGVRKILDEVVADTPGVESVTQLLPLLRARSLGPGFAEYVARINPEAARGRLDPVTTEVLLKLAADFSERAYRCVSQNEAPPESWRELDLLLADAISAKQPGPVSSEDIAQLHQYLTMEPMNSEAAEGVQIELSEMGERVRARLDEWEQRSTEKFLAVLAGRGVLTLGEYAQAKNIVAIERKVQTTDTRGVGSVDADTSTITPNDVVMGLNFSEEEVLFGTEVSSAIIHCNRTIDDDLYDVLVHELVECAVVDSAFRENEQHLFFSPSKFQFMAELGVSDGLTNTIMALSGSELGLSNEEVKGVRASAFHFLQVLVTGTTVKTGVIDGISRIYEVPKSAEASIRLQGSSGFGPEFMGCLQAFGLTLAEEAPKVAGRITPENLDAFLEPFFDKFSERVRSNPRLKNSAIGNPEAFLAEHGLLPQA